MIFESPSIRVELNDQIATLWLDRSTDSVNAFTIEMLDDLERALRVVRETQCIDLLVLRSSKAKGFSPGYDLDEFTRLRSSAERSAFAARGQQVTQLVAGLSSRLISIALIEGECRSAGLELALACDYRVAIAGPSTRFSFPESMRGLISCWGGTLRLPKLIGLDRTLEMFIQGRQLSGVQALSWGLVDRLFVKRSATIDLQAFLDRLQDSPRNLPGPRSLGRRIKDRIPLCRWFSFQQTNRWLADVPDAECPAPRAMVKAVRLGYSSPAECLSAERSLVAELASTQASRNLIANERHAAQPMRIYPEPINPVPDLPERLGIVGGGELGSALSCWLALRGTQVALQERNEECLQSSSNRLDLIFQNAIRQGAASPLQVEHARKNIRRTSSWNGFEEAGFVIEAVDEDPGAKRGIFHELELRVRPRTILVSASTTIRIEAIQAEMQRPGRVAGLHFLDPALANPIVELVRSPATESGTIAALDTWLRQWDKTPILVSDRPARLISRVHLAYLSEAVLLVAEGLPPELIDREMRRFGMRQGPLETIDAIGFESLGRLVENLQLARGDRFTNNLRLERMRAFRWNGLENGEGFYRYRRGRARPNHLARMVMWCDMDEDVVSHYIFDPQDALDAGVERLLLRTINEAASCMADERDANSTLIDLALAWGMAWAPHRGGPLRYADERGLTSVVECLTEFGERYGRRFEPCIELQRRAEAGESFHELRIPTADDRGMRVRRLAS